jgi:hypothetical protein
VHLQVTHKSGTRPKIMGSKPWAKAAPSDLRQLSSPLINPRH